MLNCAGTGYPVLPLMRRREPEKLFQFLGFCALLFSLTGNLKFKGEN